MPQAPLPAHKIRKLVLACVADRFNKTQTANCLRIARTSATKYVNAFRRSTLTLYDIEQARPAELANLLFPASKMSVNSTRKELSFCRFDSIHSRIENDGISIRDAWREEVSSNLCTYRY